jgi:hypothetical protein
VSGLIHPFGRRSSGPGRPGPLGQSALGQRDLPYVRQPHHVPQGIAPIRIDTQRSEEGRAAWETSLEHADILAAYGILSPEQAKERDRILAGRFFLVRIAGNGDVWRCKRCRAKHTYLTLNCIEQPFSGLTRGLYAYLKTVGATGAEAFLNPTQRARLAAAARLLGSQPDLATSHPLTARSLHVAERDADVGCIALGVLEPITATKARQLAAAINSRGCKPPFTLEGMEV